MACGSRRPARALDRSGLASAGSPVMLNGMRHRGILRLCALFLVLALGPALHGVQAGEMGAKMVAATGADMPASSDCGGCDGDASGGACAAVCLGLAAVLPMEPAAIPPPAVRHAVSADTLGAGRSGAPEPFPPKRSPPSLGA